jgi:hypothetical protein
MKKLIPLVVFVILFILISCKKESYSPLIGRWQWFKTSSGRIFTTSESVDSTNYIEFSRDGVYNVYDNSKKLILTKKYELGSGNKSNLLKFPESGLADFEYGFTIKNDTLSISNLDGMLIWTDYYNRIK